MYNSLRIFKHTRRIRFKRSYTSYKHYIEEAWNSCKIEKPSHAPENFYRNHQQLFEKVEEYMNKAIDTCEDENVKPEILIQRAFLAKKFGQINKARDYLWQALGFLDQHNYRKTFCETMAYIAFIFAEKGNIEEAKKLFEQAKLLDSQKQVQCWAHYCYELGNIFMKLNKFEDAKEYFNEALQHLKDNDINFTKMELKFSILEKIDECNHK